MGIEKKRNFIIKVCWLAIVFFLIYISVKLIGNILLPFVFGFIIASIIKKPVEFLHKKFLIGKGVISAMILTGIYLVCILIIFLSGHKVYEVVVNQIENVPIIYEEKIAPILNIVIYKIETLFPHIENMFDIEIDTVISETLSALSKITTYLLQRVTSAVTKIPSIVMGITFAIASSYFFAQDYNNVTKAVMRQFAPEVRKRIIDAKDSAMSTIRDYIRVYGIIIFCTFTELMIGFTVIGMKNVVGIAAVIAIIDILPIVGTGTFLIPWGVVLCIIGDLKKGISILILYVLITLIRQVLEPKIVGKKIGISPILTLFGIYLGGKVMGIFGIIIMPISLAVFKNWNDEGILHLYK